VIVIGGSVMIIIGGTVITIGTTTLIIIAAIVAFVLFLLLLYLLYQLSKKPKKPGKIVSETKQTQPTPRTRTNIGVGEEVQLTYTGGSTTWTTTGGTLSGTTGATVLLTAPDTARSITVAAGGDTLVLTVIAPSNVVMDRHGTAMQHDQTYPNSGIRIRPYIAPDTVNFYNIVYHEMDVNGVPTPGEYSCNPFKHGHCRAGGGGVPCPDLPVLNTVVAGKGTQTKYDDCAYSGWCTHTPPFQPGSVSLSIPHEYKVGSGSVHSFAPVSQVHTVQADGNTLTTVKDGEKGTTTVNSPSSSNGC
jgi:hypothetical protein